MKCVDWKVSVGVKCVHTSRMDSFLIKVAQNSRAHVEGAHVGLKTVGTLRIYDGDGDDDSW